MDINYQPPEDQQNALELYTENLTAKARRGEIDPVIGRDEEIRRVIHVLSRRTKNNPVLLGDPGVGKTAIVEGLASRIVAHDVPDSLRNRQVLSLNISSLLAGASYRGEFEKRLKSVLEQIEKSDGQYVLFIDELHTIVGAGGAEGALDAGNMLKPALARGKLHAIGATTISEYRKYIEKDSALERRFQPVYIDEPSIEDTVSILRGIKEKYEMHHGVQIADEALIAAVTLSVRYITDRFLPDKAIDLIDEAAASAKIEIDSLPVDLDKLKRKIIQLDIELAALKKEKGLEVKKKALEKEREKLHETFEELHLQWTKEKQIIKELQAHRIRLDMLKQELEKAERDILLEKAAELKYGKLPEEEKKVKDLEEKWSLITKGKHILREKVGSNDIASIIARWTKIPVERLLTSETEKLRNIEKELNKSVIGQDSALTQIARAIRRSRTGLSDEGKPIGSFLFLGPTGVGKTETARALAKLLFNSKDALVRIDMSEYQEAHSVARLIGSPPGYVGYEEGGQLTEAVRRRPYSVILFDEIEKAHPQVFNTFLQILDDGRLTDGRGRLVNFKNTIIIITSNLGSTLYETHKKTENRNKEIMEKVKTFFPPEFLNRLDSIVIFNALTPDIMRQIIQLQEKELQIRLSKQGLYIEFGKSLNEYLLRAGFDEAYGARPLKRVINELIVDEIAGEIIEGKIKSGDRVIVDYKEKKITIIVKKPN